MEQSLILVCTAFSKNLPFAQIIHMKLKIHKSSGLFSGKITSGINWHV